MELSTTEENRIEATFHALWWTLNIFKYLKTLNIRYIKYLNDNQGRNKQFYLKQFWLEWIFF